MTVRHLLTGYHVGEAWHSTQLLAVKEHVGKWSSESRTFSTISCAALPIT